MELDDFQLLKNQLQNLLVGVDLNTILKKMNLILVLDFSEIIGTKVLQRRQQKDALIWI